MTIEQFCQEFDIDPIQESYALQILKGESLDADTVTIFKFSQKLHDLTDDFFVYKDDTQVSYFKINYKVLVEQFERLPSKYKADMKEEFQLIVRDFQLLQGHKSGYRLDRREYE